uniref:Polypeptide N-acetylgalactosaminyltransferase n=1 Tax=Panstrongylus lignarius TaxID=156445 RepID=A0A224XDQ8_9HEMI
MSHYGLYSRKFLHKLLVLCSCIIFVWFIFVWGYADSPLVISSLTKQPVGPSFYKDDIVPPKQFNFILEHQITKDEANIIPGLGNHGRAVRFADRHLEKVKEIMKIEAFNLILSNKIAYNRSILDARHPNCLYKYYDTNLLTASVVIIFTNERWSTLMRTIYSVLNRTPYNILHEIILVDDASDHVELKDKLDYYIDTRFPKFVKLYRLKERSGLIRARLHGARKAAGDVLIFLDAHCEVGVKWAEPLVARIKEDRKNVVVPIIDVIDDMTFEYQNNGGSYDFEVGGFTWSGHFTWIKVSKEEKIRRQTPEAPTRSPTMAGGLFAIDRKYFWEIGSYDEGMDLWGGENLEMSFRVWQCGGIMETIPCSRVGHVFRSFHPYSFPGDKDSHGINTARTVRVWMDEYQRLFFLHRPDLKDFDIGNITSRLQLRKSLKCKSFSWYLQNIYKNKFIPDENVEAYGRALTQDGANCLDCLQQNEDEKYNLGFYPCHASLFSSQLFSFSRKGELRREFTCAEVDIATRQVFMDKCDDSARQKWKLEDNGQLVNVRMGECLDAQGVPVNGTLRVALCDINRPTQIWIWDHYL